MGLLSYYLHFSSHLTFFILKRRKSDVERISALRKYELNKWFSNTSDSLELISVVRIQNFTPGNVGSIC